jgi:signal recognition particle GTPase
MSKTQSIIKNIVSTTGSSEGSEVYMIADVVSGQTELVITKSFTERYPITDYEKVMELYEKMNRGGGRKCWELKDFT